MDHYIFEGAGLGSFSEEEFLFQGQVMQEFFQFVPCVFCMARFAQFFFLLLYLVQDFFLVIAQPTVKNIWFIPSILFLVAHA